ncbi:hypothetical protein AAIJ07_31020 [Pseudomonas aeruginosa]|uniref:hypothetical protein n=1 Tax=Pseudomonas aeruginosa TaxID=287 RepID=UPI0031B6D48E
MTSFASPYSIGDTATPTATHLMAKASALLMSSVTGAFSSRPFFIVNLNRIRLHFAMFSLALLKVRNTKPRLVPTNGVFTFIHFRFACSQDFVLSARVAIHHF